MLPDFLWGEEEYIVGTVDMEAQTIYFPAQKIYEEDGYPYWFLKEPEGIPADRYSVYVLAENAEGVYATFDDDYTITFKGFSYGWDYEPLHGNKYGIYPGIKNGEAIFTRVIPYEPGDEPTDDPSSVQTLVANDGEAQYFDFQGRAIKGDDVMKGLFIKVQNGKATKVIKK